LRACKRLNQDALAGSVKPRNAVSSVIVAIFILGVLLSFMVSFYLIINDFGRTMSNVIFMVSKVSKKEKEILNINNYFLTPSGIVLNVANNGSSNVLIKLAYVRDCSTGKYVVKAVNTLLHPRNSTNVVINGTFNVGGRYVIALITNDGNVFRSKVKLNDYITLVKVRNNVPEELIDYQVPIELNSTWVGWSYVNPQGSDVYVTGISGKPLHYWIQHFDPVAKEALIWVKVPDLRPLSEATLLLHYGGSNPYAPYYGSPYGTFFLFVNLSQWVNGYLDGDATYNSTTHILQLTANVNNEIGYLYFPEAPSNPIGFGANFTFRAYGHTSTTGADAVWLGAYDTTHSGTREDIVKRGYHFTYDEYQDRIAFTNSTVDNGAPLAYATVTTIDNGVWHNASIFFWYNQSTRSATANIYYDGTLEVNYTVKVAYTQINVMLGKGEIVIGGRTGGLNNYHQLKGVICVRKYVSPEPTVTLVKLP